MFFVIDMLCLLAFLCKEKAFTTPQLFVPHLYNCVYHRYSQTIKFKTDTWSKLWDQDCTKTSKTKTWVPRQTSKFVDYANIFI